MHWLTDTLKALGGEILVSASARAAISLYALRKYIPPTLRRAYLFDLRERVRSMPFIYRDLPGEVLQDFVDVTIVPLDPRSLAALRSDPHIHLSDDDKLRRNSKILVLGNAGIGKTTYQRHCLLTLLLCPHSASFTYQAEHLLPIYVPLKAIDNSEPWPILRYILTAFPYFEGPTGLRRLLRLARHRRLCFFLDGYDEIPFTGDGHNFVRRELNEILTPPHKPDPGTDPPANWIAFYEAARSCRVWISSRKEFFSEHNPCPLTARRDLQDPRIMAIQIQGVGNNRLRLVRNIFDKYRRRLPEARDYLNEEYFLGVIDTAIDVDIREMSYVPLFLTVMCYTYATRAIHERTHEVKWSDTFDGIIEECVELLLLDVDRWKARNLPEAHRRALLDRRAEFHEEKKDFVRCLAGRAFFDGKALFDVSYVREVAETYFERESSSANAAVILRGLRESGAKRPDFVTQLYYCGVLVMVDKRGNEILLDFPHRRFREVLAARYLGMPARYAHLLQRLHEHQFSELAALLRKLPAFADTGFQELALKHILEGQAYRKPPSLLSRMTANFMTLVPQSYDPGPLVGGFMLGSLRESAPAFTVSESLAKAWHPQNEQLDEIVLCANESCKRGELARLRLALELLGVYAPPLCREVLRGIVAAGHSSPEVFGVLVREAVLLEPWLLLGWLDPLRALDQGLSDTSGLISAHICLDRPDISDFAARLVAALTIEERWVVLFNFARLRPEGFELFRRAIDAKLNREDLMSLPNVSNKSWAALLRRRCYSAGCNWITSDNWERIQRRLASIKTDVFCERLVKRGSESGASQADAYVPEYAILDVSEEVLNRLRSILRRGSVTVHDSSAFELKVKKAVKEVQLIESLQYTEQEPHNMTRRRKVSEEGLVNVVCECIRSESGFDAMELHKAWESTVRYAGRVDRGELSGPPKFVVSSSPEWME